MLDAKWNDWRTSTVIAICRRIRQTGDFSALPILADALQDAGCTEEETLGRLRSEPSAAAALRLVALIEGGAPAAAVAWIDKFLEPFHDGWYEDSRGEWVDVADTSRTPPGVKYHEQYRLSYEDLMQGAEEFLRTGAAYCLPFVTPDEAYEEGNVNTFWTHFSTITGTRAGSDTLFFRCAC